MARYVGGKKGIAIIPTLLTLGNGFCGFVAIAKTIDALTAAGDGLFAEVAEDQLKGEEEPRDRCVEHGADAGCSAAGEQHPPPRRA